MPMAVFTKESGCENVIITTLCAKRECMCLNVLRKPNVTHFDGLTKHILPTNYFAVRTLWVVIPGLVRN